MEGARGFLIRSRPVGRRGGVGEEGGREGLVSWAVILSPASSRPWWPSCISPLLSKVSKVGKDPGLRLKIREEEEWTRPLDHQPDQGVHQPGHHLPELHARLAGDAGIDGGAISRGQNGRMESQHSQDTQVRGNALSFSYVSRKRKTNSLLRWQNWRWRACTARTTWSQPADASPPPPWKTRPSRAPPQTQSPPTPPPPPHGTWGRWWQASPAQTPTIPSGGRQRQHATIICCRKHITLIILWNILRSQDCLLAAPTKPSSSPYSFGCLTAFLVLDHFPGNQQGNRGPQSKNSLSMSRGRYVDQGHTWKWVLKKIKTILL